MTNNLRDLCKEEKGLAMVLVAAAMTVILGFAALVVDVGALYLTRDRLINACDAAALAAAYELPGGQPVTVAEGYLELNGIDPNMAQISVSTDNKRVSITANHTVYYTFARVLGFTSKTVHARAAAERDGLPAIAEYALFSGSQEDPLVITTDSCVVNGAVHTNESLSVTGDGNTFNSIVEYVVTPPTLKLENGNQYNAGHTEGEIIPIPDYSEQVEALCSPSQVYENNLSIGDGFTLDSGIWVKGDVTVTADNLDGTGGYILADDDITINGNEGSYLFSDDLVCFYSKNGNIFLNGDDLNFRGILYAPNGQVSLTGDSPEIEGSVIGNTVSYTEEARITRDQEVWDGIFGANGPPRLVE